LKLLPTLSRVSSIRAISARPDLTRGECNAKIQLLILLLICTIINGTVLPTLGQTRRRAAGGATSTPVKQTSTRCSGGWSGVVTFKKTLKDSLESDDPGIRKATDRIKHKTSRDYDYTAKAVVDGKDPQNAIVNTNISVHR
jgi:hypothetical protein